MLKTLKTMNFKPEPELSRPGSKRFRDRARGWRDPHDAFGKSLAKETEMIL